MPIFYSSQFRPSLHTNNTRTFFIVSYARDPVNQSAQFYTQNKPTAARPRAPAGIYFFPFAAKVFRPSQGKRLTTVTSLRKLFAPLPQKTLLSLLPFCGKFFLSPRHSKIFSFVPPSRGEGGIQGGWAGKCKRSIFVSSTLSRTACDPPCPTDTPLKHVLRGAEVAPQPKVLQKKRTSAEYADAPCLERRQQPILPGR